MNQMAAHENNWHCFNHSFATQTSGVVLTEIARVFQAALKTTESTGHLMIIFPSFSSRLFHFLPLSASQTYSEHVRLCAFHAWLTNKSCLSISI